MADDNNRVYQKLKRIVPNNTVVTDLAFGLYESARDEFIQEKSIEDTPDGKKRLRQWTEDWTEQRFKNLINTASTTLDDFSHALLSEHIEEQKQTLEKILENQKKRAIPFLWNVLSNIIATLLLPIILIVAYLSIPETLSESLLSFLKNLLEQSKQKITL